MKEIWPTRSNLLVFTLWAWSTALPRPQTTSASFSPMTFAPETRSMKTKMTWLTADLTPAKVKKSFLKILYILQVIREDHWSVQLTAKQHSWASCHEDKAALMKATREFTRMCILRSNGSRPWSKKTPFFKISTKNMKIHEKKYLTFWFLSGNFALSATLTHFWRNVSGQHIGHFTRRG